MKILYYAGWLTMRRVEADLLGRSSGGTLLKIRFRTILGFKHTKWVASTDTVALDPQFDEVAELEKMAHL